MADDKTFTQAEMDSIIEGRLARERQKYADYDDLKEKASKYDEYQAQNKTELQKEKEKSDALQAKLSALEKNSISIRIFYVVVSVLYSSFYDRNQFIVYGCNTIVRFC